MEHREPSPEAEAAGDILTTPFEDWCSAMGTHPEAPGAWELFTKQARAS